MFGSTRIQLMIEDLSGKNLFSGRTKLKKEKFGCWCVHRIRDFSILNRVLSSQELTSSGIETRE